MKPVLATATDIETAIDDYDRFDSDAATINAQAQAASRVTKTSPPLATSQPFMMSSKTWPKPMC
jgi:hypothetical protein